MLIPRLHPQGLQIPLLYSYTGLDVEINQTINFFLPSLQLPQRFPIKRLFKFIILVVGKCYLKLIVFFKSHIIYLFLAYTGQILNLKFIFEKLMNKSLFRELSINHGACYTGGKLLTIPEGSGNISNGLTMTLVRRFNSSVLN